MMRIQVFRVQPHCLLVFLCRGFDVPAAQVGPGKPVMNLAVIFLDLRKLLILLDSLGKTASCGVDFGQTAASTDVVGQQFQGLAVFNNSFIQQPFFVIDKSEVVMDEAIVSIEIKDFL